MCASGVHAGGTGEKQSSARGERPDVGLSRRQRISSPKTFREAFETGTRCAGKYMTMWVRAAEDACLRLGVVAGRKSFPRAVERSRVKRLLREAFRLNRFRFGGRYDVILVARRPMIEVRRQEVEKELLTLAQKAGIMGKVN